VSRLFDKPPARRVIDYLRRKYPGEWRYYQMMHEWHRTDGKVAYMEARLAPQYDGDDNHFTSYLVVEPDRILWRSR
jgi:hypothetical protein